MDKRPIGVFDSGVGGLTVFSVLKENLTDENFIVLGDTKNNPYGVKTPEEIGDLSVNAYKKLKEFDIKAMVIGCNTATVYGLDKIKEIADIPIIGIIDPGVSQVLKHRPKNLLILATQATVNSGQIQKKLEDEDINIEAIACPDMVKAVESGDAKNEKGYEVVKKYLDQATIDEDAVLLACTHFPAMTGNIKKYYEEKNKDVTVINPADGALDFVKDEIEPGGVDDPYVKYFTTGDPDTFRKSGNIVLGGKFEIEEVHHI